MYNYNQIILLCLLLLITSLSINGQRQESFTMTVAIFDHYPEYNENFEADVGTYTGLKPGMVKKTLNETTKIPDLVIDEDLWRFGRIIKPDLFPSFFSNTPNINKFIPYDLTFTLKDNNGIYTMENQNFFPINGQGWDVDYDKAHEYKDAFGEYQNFHFCLKLNSYFTYRGNEEFFFKGDDDVWVFINNKLAVDLGGLHSAEEGSVDLTTLNLVKGKTYPFDFYYCERHTDQSTIRIDTNIEVRCLWFDFCGICNGDGSSCCSASKDCDDKDSCTIDACPAAITPGANPDNVAKYCNHTKITCDAQTAADKCNAYKCEGGSCVVGDKKPAPLISCQVGTHCDPKSGWLYKPLCSNNDKCTSLKCVPGSDPTKDRCDSTPVNCNGTDQFCTVYSCDSASGCLSQPKTCMPETPEACTEYFCTPGKGCDFKKLSEKECGCCDPSKTEMCKVAKCNTNTEKCEYSDVVIDNSDPCMVGHCNLTTGQITYTPVVCSGCQVCSRAANGTCVDTDSLCSHANQCTDVTCQAGECKATSIPCQDNDPCTIDKCDPTKGCDHSEKLSCPDEGLCLVGQCTPGVGCTVTNRTCDTGDFCMDSLCDPRLGCMQFARKCVAPDPDCQYGVCNNETQKCDFHEYSPKPFGCNKAAVISTGVIAGIVVAGAVALAVIIFGGKKGYDHWKSANENKITTTSSNPLYTENPASGTNPLFVESSNA
ncbi:hypothetical protein SAMD00019534_056560 [Acytostelium subglobosum LB1]|uniref:hypothetical protein n=1 Tax=Acytostelium subglobosum LB1 TaxID=1410327 RepID=UPI000644E5E1|nr:hypothetical protein SAMD00019534_056560 [Acytostelium subglobosum LB1]GAM22481.1 hypothetical protein SAMD00019534_056560 [Acytostelium subglobosum LB1]|eukprot:XP_012754601.1 hypothetical protein SAMD00019534_056560 [Acytostelium subglobosum LB1]